MTPSQTTVTRCRFIGNRAVGGVIGAGINVTGASVISNCVFVNNVAQYFGGGASIHGASNATIVGCTFAGNVAGASGEGGGGGLYNVAALVFLENSVFARNSAPSGGGMYTNDYWFPHSPVLRNCTF